MPFDAQGRFSRVMNWQQDAANDIPIEAGRHDDEDDNFANGFNNTVCRDGRATMTGQLKMGGFKISGLGAGTSNNDAVNKSQLDAVSVDISTALDTMLASLYPVGSIYLGTQSSCPLANLIANSTWVLVGTDKALWGGNGSNANTSISAGLPNVPSHFHYLANTDNGRSTYVSVTDSNYLCQEGGASATQAISYRLNGTNTAPTVAKSSSAQATGGLYGQSNTVQPPAYRVNIWRRTA